MINLRLLHETEHTTGKSASRHGAWLKCTKRSFRCDVLKRAAAPADAKTCKSAEPQILAANTKTERQEISRRSGLVSQHLDELNVAWLMYWSGESPYAEGVSASLGWLSHYQLYRNAVAEQCSSGGTRHHTHYCTIPKRLTPVGLFFGEKETPCRV